MPKENLAPAEKPDPQQAAHEAAKAAFEEAKRKTALQEGRAAPDEPKAEAAKAEEPAAEPAPAPKPKPKAKPKPAAPPPDPMAPVMAQLQALQAKLTALESKPKEPEVDPMDAHRARLVEKFGEDEAEALLEYAEALNAPAAKRLAELEETLKKAHAQGQKQLVKANRKRLGADFPNLKESDEAWEVFDASVRAVVDRNPDKYSTWDEAYDDVASKLYGSLEQQEDVEAETDDEDEPSEEDEKKASQIAAAALTPPAKAGKRDSRSKLDKQREHFEFMKKNPSDKQGHARLARDLGIDR